MHSRNHTVNLFKFINLIYFLKVFEIKKKYFNSVNPNSKANKFRRKRFELFIEILEDIIKNKVEDYMGKRNEILNVGGCLSRF